MIYIFIDESGTLPDPKNPIIVLAALATNQPRTLAQSLDKIRKGVKPVRKTAGWEIKFYTASEKTKERHLKILAKQNPIIFVTVIEKGAQAIPDSPENYAVLCWLLLIDCFAYYRNERIRLIFDRHFHRERDEKKFFAVLAKLFEQPLTTEAADSRKNQGITAADMVAGSLLSAQSGKDPRFYSLIERRVVSHKIVHWKETKKRFIEAIKKTRSNRRKRPSEARLILV